MLAKRIVPCLDVCQGRVVKGVNFVGLKDVGDPVELASFYADQGADELVFLDISASHEDRKPILKLLEKVASCVFIPLTLGGGISSVDDVRNALNAGADKVSINSAAVKNPDLIRKVADKVGSQAVVLAVDAKFQGDKWLVYTHGGRRPTDIDVIEWCKDQCEKGAGEVLLTSMDADGTKKGFDIALLKEVYKSVSVPLIASGGVGQIQHFVDAAPFCDALLAASVFHNMQFSIKEVKDELKNQGYNVRI